MQRCRRHASTESTTLRHFDSPASSIRGSPPALAVGRTSAFRCPSAAAESADGRGSTPPRDRVRCAGPAGCDIGARAAAQPLVLLCGPADCRDLRRRPAPDAGERVGSRRARATSFALIARTNGAWRQTLTGCSTATGTRLARSAEPTAATQVTTATSFARTANTSGASTGTAASFLACGPVARSAERKLTRPKRGWRSDPAGPKVALVVREVVDRMALAVPDGAVELALGRIEARGELRRQRNGTHARREVTALRLSLRRVGASPGAPPVRGLDGLRRRREPFLGPRDLKWHVVVEVGDARLRRRR